MGWMFRNSAGNRDGMFTFACITIFVVLVKVLGAGLVVKGIAFGSAPDAGLVAALLTPTLGAYVARRNGIGSPSIPSPDKPAQ